MESSQKGSVQDRLLSLFESSSPTEHETNGYIVKCDASKKKQPQS
jgi:hypothetical protein